MKSKNMKLTKQVWTMPMHSCGNEDVEATASAERHDAGAGDYIVLNINEWSLDNVADLDVLYDKIKEMLEDDKP